MGSLLKVKVSEGLRIEPARADQAKAISDLALRSKGYWGYDDEFLSAVREELTYAPADCASGEIFVAYLDRDVVGFGRLSGDRAEGELDALFVDPPWIGTGVGGALLTHALDRARGRGMSRLRLDADPRAESFYARFGARRIGEVPSGSIEGRVLPRMEFQISKIRCDPIRKLSTGEWGLDEFRALLRESGMPLVERVSPHEVDATFVHEMPDGDGDVLLEELIGWSPPEQRRLEPIAGTPFRALTLRMRSDLRFAYGLEVRLPGHDAELISDPLNPPIPDADPRLDASVAVLPDARDLPWSPLRLAGVAADIDRLRFTSRILGNERNIWVSTPPGWSPDSGPYPFIVIFDGTEGHSAPRVRDELVRQGLIRPCVLILIDQIGLRATELTCNETFSQMVAQELVPRLRGPYALSSEPADAALSGSSFGGLCSAWTALRHADVFGNALLQSPSCWYHPGLGQEGDTEALRRRFRTPSLIAAFQAADAAPIRIHQECGELELGPPPARISQVFGNRWLHDVLRSKGYDTRYQEFAGGHDAVWWRGTWGTGAQWLFPGDDHD